MPTPLDKALQSRNAFLGFAGIVTAVAAWSIWGGDIFPVGADPQGDPETWEDLELRSWLQKRSLLPDGNATREQLIERVRANMRPPPRS